jgi:hypothetical protein
MPTGTAGGAFGLVTLPIELPVSKVAAGFGLNPEWGGDGELSKRFIELMKRLGDIGHQFRLGLAAIEQSNVISNKKN